MLAVELTLLMSEGVHEDGSTARVIGRGFFQDDFSGLLFAIKDSERFADEPPSVFRNPPCECRLLAESSHSTDIMPPALARRWVRVANPYHIRIPFAV